MDAERFTTRAVEIDDALEAEGFAREDIAGIAGAILAMSLAMLPPERRAAVMLAHRAAAAGMWP